MRPNKLPLDAGDWSPDPDDDTSVDDLVISNAQIVHLERMSATHYWLGVYVNGEVIHIDITSQRRIKARVRR